MTDPVDLTAALVRCPSVTPEEGGAIRLLERMLARITDVLVAGKTDESLAIAARLAEQHKEVEVQLQYAELLLSAGKPREAESRLNEMTRAGMVASPSRSA